jgi:hypothetical protein
MAVRRHKPALIELINKGDLSTPTWFYGRKKVRLQKLREATVVTDSTKSAPQEDGQEVDCARPEALFQSRRKAWLELADKKLLLSIPCWALPIVAMGLILALLIAYRLGQPGGVVSELKPRLDSSPSGQLKEVPAQSARNDFIPPKTTKTEGVGGTPSQAATPKTADVVPPVNSPPPASGGSRTGQRLIMCSDKNKSKLEPVQKYFADKGILTEIGQFGGSFVLVSSEPFENEKSAEAVAFKSRVANLGIKGNLGFDTAFRTMLWVGANRIE